MAHAGRRARVLAVLHRHAATRCFVRRLHGRPAQPGWAGVGDATDQHGADRAHFGRRRLLRKDPRRHPARRPTHRGHGDAVSTHVEPVTADRGLPGRATSTGRGDRAVAAPAFVAGLRGHGDRPAVFVDDAWLTYRELADRVRPMGSGPGDVWCWWRRRTTSRRWSGTSRRCRADTSPCWPTGATRRRWRG